MRSSREVRLAGLQSLEAQTAHRDPGWQRRHMRKHRNDARFVRDPGEHCRPLDRNARAKVLFLAEKLERRTKAPGRRNGALGYIGLAVLRALIVQFAHARTGLCCPSYLALMTATGLCRQAIADALARLEATGLVKIVRRLVRETITRTSPITGQVEAITTTVQGSNLYAFLQPQNLVVLPMATGKPKPFPDRRQPDLLSRVQAIATESPKQGREDQRAPGNSSTPSIGELLARAMKGYR
jgi:hypothetical protein